MKFSGTTGLVISLIVIALAGGGTYFFRTAQETKRMELAQEAKRLKQEARATEKAQAEAEVKAKEAEKAAAEAKRVAAVKAVEEQKLRKEAADAESRLVEKKRVAAEAETEKLKAQEKVQAQAKALAEQKAETEQLALRRAEEERRRAEAELAKELAGKAIVEAALAKSENDRKAAEANAAAAHDRKLRMYRRAETSRAELLELQRAERRLALEETGGGVPTEDSAGVDTTNEHTGNETLSETNAVIAVVWQENTIQSTEAEVKLEAARSKLDARAASEQLRHARDYVSSFGKLIAEAQQAKRNEDVSYYRQTLRTLVPDYQEVYAVLAEEARTQGHPDRELACLREMMSLVPTGGRVSACVRLFMRDEEHYAEMLTKLATRGEYVAVFKKMIDVARRSDADRDEREAKMDHYERTLAKYVPDYEKCPEWK